MINRKHDLPLVQQCKALKVHRTTIYREPKPVKQEQLDLMKVIDTIHLDEPAWGVRKVRQYLIESGIPVGRRHCNTLSVSWGFTVSTESLGRRLGISGTRYTRTC
jgi:putative transposase